MHNTARLIAKSITTAILAIASTHPVVGQDTPVVFLHGLQGNGSVWYWAGNQLAATHRIAPLLPTTGWADAFSVQGQSLSTFLGSLTGLPAVAHSNGGLVARAHVQTAGSGAKVDRLMTVGTPHQGAPVATAARNGTFLATFLLPYWATFDAAQFYASADWGSAWGWPFYMLEAALLFVQQYPYVLDYIGVPYSTVAAAAVAEVEPGSAFILGVNSGGNLAAEATRLPFRRAITTRVHPEGVFCEGLLESNLCRSYFQVMQYVTYMLWAHYAWDSDYWLAANAWRWEAAFEAWALQDVRWQMLIGAYQGVTIEYGWPRVVVEESDGLIPRSKAVFPGAGAEAKHIEVPYVSHMRQPWSAAVVAELRSGLAAAGVAWRSAPTASLSGPASVKPGTTCGWFVSGSGGAPPYTYSWTVNSVPQSTTGSELAYTNTGSGFTVSATVTDAFGLSGAAAKSVTVAGTAPQCFY